MQIVILKKLLLVYFLSFQLHIVHYNSEKYRSFSEAKDKKDGLAVLAFVYDVRKHKNLCLCLSTRSPQHQCSIWTPLQRKRVRKFTKRKASEGNKD